MKVSPKPLPLHRFHKKARSLITIFLEMIRTCVDRIRENDSKRTEAMVAQAESRRKACFHYAEAQETFAAGKISKEIFPAAIAQLVEHDLAKVGVASSSLVCRSKVDL